MIFTSGSDRATEQGGQVLATRSRTWAATVRVTIREQALSRGLGAPTGKAPVGGAQLALTAMRKRVCTTCWGIERERSISTHAMRMQFGELRCMRDMKSVARRAIARIVRRVRVKRKLLGVKVTTLNNRPRSSKL
eukprot:4310134-Pleurochrysis_carterae.AAC.5